MERSNGKPSFQFNKEQFSDLRKAFEIFDHDGSGLMPVKYLRIILKTFGSDAQKEEVLLLAKHIGKNYEDRINFEEFVAIMQKIMSTVPTSEFLVKAFQMYDNAKEGKIDKHDLEKVAALLGDHLSDEDIQEMISTAANNESATEVSVDDFLNMLQRPFDPKLI